MQLCNIYLNGSFPSEVGNQEIHSDIFTIHFFVDIIDGLMR